MRNKSIAILTPELRIHDGISAHSLNLIIGFLRLGYNVAVFSPSRTGVNQEAYFSDQEELEEYLQGIKSVPRSQSGVDNYELVVVQFAISSYWLRAGWIYLWVKKFVPSRVIFCCHEPKRELDILGRLGEFLYRHLLKTGSKAIVFSDEAAKMLSNLSEIPIECLSLGVPYQLQFSPTRNEVPCFLLFGYYSRDKGFELGLESFLETLEKTGAQIVLKVVASLRERKGSARILSGRDLRNFKSFSDRLLLSKERNPANFEIYGYLPDDKLHPVVASCDYLLMPYGKITNSGVAIIAKSFGVPVIANDLPPLRGAFGDSAIFPIGQSLSAWTEELQRIAEDVCWKSERDARSQALLHLGAATPISGIIQAIITPPGDEGQTHPVLA